MKKPLVRAQGLRDTAQMMIWRVTLLCLLCLLPHAAQADCVVLLHGLARGPGSMAALGRMLDGLGYRVVNSGYPSTLAPIEALAPRIGPMVAACGENLPVHFITHSMGGIVLRAYLAVTPPGKMGRVVMLAPPNGGSEIVDAFGDYAAFRAVHGPAGDQLRSTGGLAQTLPPPDYDLGIIAGSRSLNPITSAILTGADDGKVTVAATALMGAADHITLPVTHTFMMQNTVVMAQALHFIRHGQFAPEMGWAAARLSLAP